MTKMISDKLMTQCAANQLYPVAALDAAAHDVRWLIHHAVMCGWLVDCDFTAVSAQFGCILPLKCHTFVKSLECVRKIRKGHIGYNNTIAWQSWQFGNLLCPCTIIILGATTRQGTCAQLLTRTCRRGCERKPSIPPTSIRGRWKCGSGKCRSR